MRKLGVLRIENPIAVRQTDAPITKAGRQRLILGFIGENVDAYVTTMEFSVEDTLLDASKKLESMARDLYLASIKYDGPNSLRSDPDTINAHNSPLPMGSRYKVATVEWGSTSNQWHTAPKDVPPSYFDKWESKDYAEVFKLLGGQTTSVNIGRFNYQIWRIS